MTSTCLLHLFESTPPSLDASMFDSLASWQHELTLRLAAIAKPIERAVIAGFCADRLGYAFAAGYREAFAALLPNLPRGEVVSLCASEAGGAHPRAIRTRLDAREDGAFVLSGEKLFATCATFASTLLVVANAGAHDDGRPLLRVARVAPGAAGVTIRKLADTPFAPEIPHGHVRFDSVRVDAPALLPGDGYRNYLRPFRTIEDTYVFASALGYLFAVARRSTWPDDMIERIAVAIAGAITIAYLDASSPATHVTLAGLLCAAERLVDDIAPLWSTADPKEHARFVRDRPLLRVASNARDKRRIAAWQRIRGAAG